MTQEEFSRYFLERVGLLTDELARLKQAFIDCMDGKPFDEAWRDNVFLEEISEEKRARSHASRVIEHLFKLKYCTNNWNYNEWIKTIRSHQQDIQNISGWDAEQTDDKIIRAIDDDIATVYKRAITWYRLDSNAYPDLVDGLKYITETCPWTAEEISFGLIPELLNKLPDPDKLLTQMQLYPSCMHTDRNKLIENNIIWKQCRECENYVYCMADYYEDK